MELNGFWRKFQKKKLQFVLFGTFVLLLICLWDSNFEEKESFIEEEVQCAFMVLRNREGF